MEPPAWNRDVAVAEDADRGEDEEPWEQPGAPVDEADGEQSALGGRQAPELLAEVVNPCLVLMVIANENLSLNCFDEWSGL